MSQHRAKRKPPAPKTGWNNPLLWLAAGLLLVLGAITWGVIRELSGDPGSPRLAVDQERIDFGEVKLGQTVTASFTITNTGTGPLRFREAPWVELKEGC